jgi:hypothetical protein
MSLDTRNIAALKRYFLRFLDRVIKYQFSQLVFDGDR